MPRPEQVGHGSSITLPWPPHSGQGWEIEKTPWLWASIPRPSQRGQTRGAVPGFAPVPEQVGQGPVVGTETATWAPCIAWSNESLTSVSRSRPRAVREPCSRPRPKREEKISPRSEAKPPPGNPPPGNPPPPNRPAPKPAKRPPASYCLRFSGSERVLYACWI